MTTDLDNVAAVATGGIYFNERLGGWVVVGYQEAVEVLRSDAFVIEPSAQWARGDERMRRAIAPLRELESRIPIYAVGAEHRRLRDGLRASLTASAAQARRPRIREIASELVQACVGVGEVEVVEEVCRPLLRTVMAELVGIPEEDRTAFDTLIASREKFGLYGTPKWTPAVEKEVLAADREIGRYLRNLLGVSGELPADCFLATARTAHGPHGGLSEAEIVTNALMLYTTGVVTTILLLGSAAYFLFHDEVVLADARRDPAAVVPGVVSETLRFASPTLEVQPRRAVRDFAIAGHQIRRGQQVRVMALKASRSPDRFPNPDTFDHQRTPRKPLAFGLGPHTCSGNHLSIAIAEELCITLADPRYGARLATPTPTLHRAMSAPVVWGIDRLHLHLRATLAQQPSSPPPTSSGRCPFDP
ncbi:cytochrome P450 [Streptomyces sp. NPDC001139]